MRLFSHPTFWAVLSTCAWPWHVHVLRKEEYVIHLQFPHSSALVKMRFIVGDECILCMYIRTRMCVFVIKRCSVFTCVCIHVNYCVCVAETVIS